MKRLHLPRVLALVLAVTAIASGLTVASVPGAASAVDTSAFQPGYIISDARFFDYGSMTQAQIQAFLVSQEGACTATGGAPCLKNYTESTFSRAAVNPSHCSAYTGAASESAAAIIYKVAQACRINPQVLLVTLQKEQGLITAPAPTPAIYRKAMGYGCPDTAACDSAYYGFFNQVYWAAWQFRQYTYQPVRTYQIGVNSILERPPTKDCNNVRESVTIYNQATANLYNYTPYVPDPVTIAGGSDACSSYGNLNFWKYYNSWFGTSTGPVNPTGNVELVGPAPGGVRVAGWALDPDSSSPINVDVYVDGVGTRLNANLNRPDIQSAYNNGLAHGFDATLPVATAGPHQVCLYGINVGPGANVLFGCATVVTRSGPPVGYLDSAVAGPDNVTVSGWTLDPDTANSIPVDISVDGVSARYQATVTRSDVASMYAGYGSAHGYVQTIPATPGSHTVCATGIDSTGSGPNSLLGCMTVVVGGSPFGYLDSVTGGDTSFTVSGWTIDRDTSASIPVSISVDGRPTSYTANVSRPDVMNMYPAYGAAHGYSQTISASQGVHTVCATGIESAGAGTSTLLGCASVSVGHPPIGYLDSVVASPGHFTVSGWTEDPDTSASIPVDIYVDGVGTRYTANVNRPDVAALHPTLGALHGYSQTIVATPGVHKVCAYGIDSSGTGPNPLLGCATVTAMSGSPVGVLDSVSAVGNVVTAWGWAYDPDVIAPISVRVTVDSIASVVQTSVARPDVAAVYPAYGVGHGFTQSATVSSGRHVVCAYGVNVGPGADTLLGCKTIVI
jgi:hypothetical protein